MEMIWDLLDAIPSSPNFNGSLDLDPKVDLDMILQLSTLFLMDGSTTGNMAHLPLVYFSAVLGIHPDAASYRTAFSYTPYVAGLVWIGRLLILEHALPKTPYSFLPAATNCANPLQRLREHQSKYLCRGTGYPIDQLLDTLLTGRAMANKDGARTNISWSQDGKTLNLNKQLIDIDNFYNMVYMAIEKAQASLRQLMFNWEPAYDLSDIQDSLVESRLGWSFLSESANDLQHSFQHLQRKAWDDNNPSSLRSGQRWVPSRVAKYLRQVAIFQQQLLLCIHFTGGMPGRGTEIGSVKWCNTRTSMRNVFVRHGLLLIILEYQKAQWSHNNAFYVVRALPEVVSHLLFRYLAFVRPFADALSYHSDQLGNGNRQSQRVPYVFTTVSRAPLQTSQLTDALKKHSESTCLATLTIASYRQVVLAIAKKHIVPIAQPFNAKRPEEICLIWQSIA
jgi:hypothetical protein